MLTTRNGPQLSDKPIQVVNYPGISRLWLSPAQDEFISIRWSLPVSGTVLRNSWIMSLMLSTTQISSLWAHTSLARRAQMIFVRLKLSLRLFGRETS